MTDGLGQGEALNVMPFSAISQDPAQIYFIQWGSRFIMFSHYSAQVRVCLDLWCGAVIRYEE